MLILGLTRTRARSPQGERVRALKPFARGAKVSVIGAISLDRVLAVMMMHEQMVDTLIATALDLVNL